MSIYIARFRDTSNALISQFLVKRCVFKSRLKRSDSIAGSHNETGSDFKTVGPLHIVSESNMFMNALQINALCNLQLRPSTTKLTEKLILLLNTPLFAASSYIVENFLKIQKIGGGVSNL